MEPKTFTMPSRKRLTYIVEEWRETLGTNQINRAVSIVEVSPDEFVITTEAGVVMRLVVRAS